MKKYTVYLKKTNGSVEEIHMWHNRRSDSGQFKKDAQKRACDVFGGRLCDYEVVGYSILEHENNIRRQGRGHWVLTTNYVAEPEIFYSMKELADFIEVSLRTAYRYAKNGKDPKGIYNISFISDNN